MTDKLDDWIEAEYSGILTSPEGEDIKSYNFVRLLGKVRDRTCNATIEEGIKICDKKLESAGVIESNYLKEIGYCSKCQELLTKQKSIEVIFCREHTKAISRSAGRMVSIHEIKSELEKMKK